MEPETIAFPQPGRQLKLVFRIAAAIAALGFSAGAGFVAGRSHPETTPSHGSVAAPPARPAIPSPWARYRIEKNGPIAVVIPTEPKS
jgi:hypothetical protein